MAWKPSYGACPMQYTVSNTTIIVKQGDITEEETDAIVNAANEALQHGGGVAGAIVRKGGDIIQRESDAIGYVPVGNAASTGAGRLRARRIIHAVGPRMGEGDEDRKLESATLKSLQLADREELRSIAFPAISTGIFGYPVERCAEIMIRTAREYCEGVPGYRRSASACSTRLHWKRSRLPPRNCCVKYGFHKQAENSNTPAHGSRCHPYPGTRKKCLSLRGLSQSISRSLSFLSAVPGGSEMHRAPAFPAANRFRAGDRKSENSRSCWPCSAVWLTSLFRRLWNRRPGL